MKSARGSADEDAPTAGETTPDSTPSAIPYGFARKFGVVLLDGNPDRPIVALREDGDPRVLIAVRRHLGCAFDVETVSAADFDRHLSDRYEMAGTAAAMTNSIDLCTNELAPYHVYLPTAE